MFFDELCFCFVFFTLNQTRTRYQQILNIKLLWCQMMVTSVCHGNSSEVWPPVNVNKNVRAPICICYYTFRTHRAHGATYIAAHGRATTVKSMVHVLPARVHRSENPGGVKRLDNSIFSGMMTARPADYSVTCISILQWQKKRTDKKITGCHWAGKQFSTIQEDAW